MKKYYLYQLIIFFNIVTAQNPDGDWTISGNNMYPSISGNIGIDTENPISKLSVGGDGTVAASVYSESKMLSGRGIMGVATYNGKATNYGGYFEAKGSHGRGVYGLAVGRQGYAVEGEATGNEGCGVYGQATNNNTKYNYGGYFRANGTSGCGVYGIAIGTSGKAIKGYAPYSGKVTNYGGHFQSKGFYGYGVYGQADGRYGKAVVGYASNMENGTSFGGHFTSASNSGVGVYGIARGSGGLGVVGLGGEYDFYAAGPRVNFGTASSIRWKNNIVEIENPIDIVGKLRGIYFDWDKEHGGYHDIGMIAEEVGKVIPEIVVYEKNGVDASGMDYSKLVPLLVEVVKSQQNLIDDLTKRIEIVESN